jgi:integrase family protein with SAM-like domain
MTTARALPAYSDESISRWDRALHAFLAEKERRSGSQRTVQSYSRMLRDFFGRTHKTPDEITSQDVFAWAHGVGLSGREPSAVTINARIGCASSFFRFAIRMGTMAVNPCDALERPKIHPSPPKGLSAGRVDQVPVLTRAPDRAGQAVRADPLLARPVHFAIVTPFARLDAVFPTERSRPTTSPVAHPHNPPVLDLGWTWQRPNLIEARGPQHTDRRNEHRDEQQDDQRVAKLDFDQRP